MHSVIINGSLYVITSKGVGHYLKSAVTAEGGNLAIKESHKLLEN